MVYIDDIVKLVIRKVLECSKLSNLDWTPRIALIEELEGTYCWFVDQVQNPNDRPRLN